MTEYPLGLDPNQYSKKSEVQRRKSANEYGVVMADTLVGAHVVTHHLEQVIKADDQIEGIMALVSDFHINKQARNTNENSKIYELLCVQLNSEIMEDFNAEDLLHGERIFLRKRNDRNDNKRSEYTESDEEDLGYYMSVIELVAWKHRVTVDQVVELGDMYDKIRDVATQQYYDSHL